MASIRGAFGGAQIKGSIGSTTFQQGTSGTIIRSRTVPVNPNTPGQVKVRAAMAQSSSDWTNVLTAAQRSGWADYALTTPLPNRFGESINVGGRQMYLRSNVARLFLDLTSIPDAPATPGVATPVLPTMTGDTSSGIEIQNVLPTIATDQLVIGRISPPVSQAKNFFKAPFTLDTVLTDASTFPVEVKPAVEVSIGQRYFYAFRTFDIDGKVSEEVIVRVDITA